MNIALLGYGKMGKMIETIALDRHHQVVGTIDAQSHANLTIETLQKADVAIEFSTPQTVLPNIDLCLHLGVPVVVGTTGWHDQLHAVAQRCAENHGTVLYGSNFSIGVNLFFGINRYVATLMGRYAPDYDPMIEEIHHPQKLDAPSGTAITLAEDLLQAHGGKQGWYSLLSTNAQTATTQLPIVSHREADVPGTHVVRYNSPIDTIELIHTAKNRQGFALGAVVAAEWVASKKGFYSVKDMFTF